MRTKFLMLLLATLYLSPAAFADAQSELRGIEETRRAAIKAKDFDALGRIYAPAFVAVTGNGQFVTRDELFAVFRKTDPSLSFETDEIRIVVDGDTAVFFGRLTGRTADGKTAFASRFSHVFVHRKGKWLCIAGQSTPLPS